MAPLNLSRSSFWRTGVAAIVGLLAFVGAMQALAPLLAAEMPDALQVPIGVALAVIPALLWLIVFYVQDRAEPEPRTYVIEVAGLAALLAAAIGEPLLSEFFRVDTWLHHDSLTELLGGVLVTGVVQVVAIFAAVRYSIYYSSEFDQRIDGVLYGTAAGLGYATMLNLHTVFAAGGFADLGAGAVRIVVTALVHGAVGGLIGYFLARARFDDEPLWWLPAGLLLAALVNGGVSWLQSLVSRSALVLDATGVSSAGYNPWPALALSAVVAAALSALVFVLMRRAGEKSEAAKLDGHDTLSATITFIVAGAALLAGLLLRSSVESRVKTHADNTGVSIAYPDTWRLDARSASDGLLRVRESAGATIMELRWIPTDATLDDMSAVAQVAGSLALNRARDLASFRNFDLSSNTSGTTASFAYVTGTGGAMQENIPIVMLGEDRFIRKGGRVFVFTLLTTENGRALAQAHFERFIQSAVLP